MMISTKGRYALRVMVSLAQWEGEGFVPLKEIAQQQQISEKYLEAIVKLLVKAGFVVGLRGKGGGYRLARQPGEYTMKEILDVTEGDLVPVACLEQNAQVCPRANGCVTLPLWQGLNQVIRDYLSGITLEQLGNQAKERGISAGEI